MLGRDARGSRRRRPARSCADRPGHERGDRADAVDRPPGPAGRDRGRDLDGGLPRRRAVALRAAARAGSSESRPTASRATSRRWATRSTSAPTASSCPASSRATTPRRACARTASTCWPAPWPRARACVWAAGCPFVQRLSTGDGRLRKLAERLPPVPGAGDGRELARPVPRARRRRRARCGCSATRSTGGSGGSTRAPAAIEATIAARRSPPTSVGGRRRSGWITDGVDDRVVPLDVASGRAARAGPRRPRRRAGSRPARARSGSRTRSTARCRASIRATRRVVATIEVGGLPRGVAAGDGAVWVTAHACELPPDRVARGGRGARGLRAGGEERPLRIGVIVDCAGVYRSLEDAELSGAALPLIERGARPARPPRGRRAHARAGGRPAVELVPRLHRGARVLDAHHRAAPARRAGARRRRRRRRHRARRDRAARRRARSTRASSFVPVVHGPREVTLHRPAPNLFRFAADHGQGVAGLGEYAYRDARLAAASPSWLANWDAGWSGRDAFVAEFCALGGARRRATSASDCLRPDGRRRRARPARRRRRRRVRARVLRSGGLPAPARAGEVGDPARQIVVGPGLIDDPALLRETRGALDGVVGSSNVDPERLRGLPARVRARLPRRARPSVAGSEQVSGYRDAVEAVLRGARAGRRATPLACPAQLARLQVDLLGGRVRLDANRQAVVSTSLVRIARPPGAPSSSRWAPSPASTSRSAGCSRRRPRRATGRQLPARAAAAMGRLISRRARDRPGEARVAGPRRQAARAQPAPDEQRRARRRRSRARCARARARRAASAR